MLADDFTGAMDAGMQLLGTYSDIPVILSRDKIPQVSAPWMVLNTQSRNLPAQKGVVLHMYDGYGHAAYDTAPDYRKRLLQWFRG